MNLSVVYNVLLAQAPAHLLSLIRHWLPLALCSSDTLASPSTLLSARLYPATGPLCGLIPLSGVPHTPSH